MGTLLLVRHGESEWNLAGRVQGQSPAAGGLTERGRAQAARTAARLAREHPDAGAVFTSDLPRARETAEIIAGTLGLPLAEDPLLREQYLGELEGRAFDEPEDGGTVRDLIERLWRRPDERPPGGESITGLYLRVHGVLADYVVRRPGKLILIAHGGPVRVATTAADPLCGEPVPRSEVGNASITQVAPERLIVLRDTLCPAAKG
ncbi:histidine phosphatase family protein [Amycolatopsis cynarae]|uniref:Histidine phosphatase family protein n=1 Tax=Amycolatopsis cynarae TaxID=2995223 RepID=A0ABY7AT87_9PSEU|nr:histidine phosphatase family protein [Amycolatopsis sp. HUAS 11-8]WAL63175.1 histidine phosphatase family protein [Amycolatopsis sp. HUAS 11-8]